MITVFTFETRDYILLKFGKMRIGFYSDSANVNVWRIK